MYKRKKNKLERHFRTKKEKSKITKIIFLQNNTYYRFGFNLEWLCQKKIKIMLQRYNYPTINFFLKILLPLLDRTCYLPISILVVQWTLTQLV